MTIFQHINIKPYSKQDLIQTKIFTYFFHPQVWNTNAKASFIQQLFTEYPLYVDTETLGQVSGIP